MISYLEGKLVHKEPTYVIIDVGGVGYRVHVSLNTSSELAPHEQFRVFTHLQIREDAHTLYGFSSPEEQALFSLLISVSGIGGNLALIILSSLSPTEIKRAILQEDVRTIQSVKGIGSKTAQRLILELKDKIKKEDMLSESGAHPLPKDSKVRTREEAILALSALGINKSTAEKNIDKVIKAQGEDLTVEDLIKFALKI